MKLLYLVHTTCAILSISGFALRGFWMLREDPRLAHRLTRVLPHTIDTLLLGSAVGMLYLWGLYPWQAGWLMAKIVALLLYIALGMVALRFGNTLHSRACAGLLALMCAFYIVSVALTKSPFGPLAWL